MNKIKIAILGGGHVGGALISDIVMRDLEYDIAYVLVSEIERERNHPEVNVVDDIQQILDDKEVQAIVEILSEKYEDYDVLVEKLNASDKYVFLSNHNFYGVGNPDGDNLDKRRVNGIALAREIVETLDEKFFGES